MTSTNWITKLFTAVTVLAVASGCLSEEEKEARRAWAYDISGEYDEAREEGVEAGEVTITEESSKNDIKITFVRGAIYAGEQEYIDLIADDDERALVVAELVLGEGESEAQESLVGGENISDNFGESSKLSVGGPSFDATPKLEGATDAKVSYAMSAEILNQSDELRGTLTVRYQDHRPDPDDAEETELHTESESFDIVLKRRAGPIDGDVCEDCTTGASDDEQVADGTAEETAGEGA